MSCEKPYLRCVVAGEDARNRLGNVFGGWLLSQMDIASGEYAAGVAQGAVVTISVKDMVFEKPLYVGDEILIKTTTDKIGRTSIAVRVDVDVRRGADKNKFEENAANGIFVFVAIDENHKPRPVPQS